jgi:hypothetical protein
MKYSIDVKKFIYIKYFQNKFIHEFINKFSDVHATMADGFETL